MHDFGATDHDLAAVAEPLDGPFVAMLAEQARRLGATVIAGMFERTGDLPFNTLVAVGRTGRWPPPTARSTSTTPSATASPTG